MNGIHEVTGSIPVWSTILRSRTLPPKRPPSTHARKKPRRSSGSASHASDETRAIRFERYLKTGSGRAFAKRHFEP